MTTAIDICNNALDLVGQGLHIESFDDQSKEADLCKRNYQVAFDRIVTRYDFSFLKKKASISTTTSCTANSFSYAYALPADFLRSLYAVKNSSSEERIDYSIVNENGKQIICTNQSAPFILNYITNTTTLSALSPIIIESLEYYLASRFITAFAHGTNSIQISQFFLEQSNNLLQQAYLLDADQNTKDENTITTICNNALALTGSTKQITSLEEASKEANLLRTSYQSSIDFCLNRYNFDFLYKKITLMGAVSNYSDNNFTYAYTLPIDYSKPLFIDSTTGAPFNIVVSGGTSLLCCNIQNPTFNYISKNASIYAIPPKIIEAIEYYLASRLVSALGTNENAQDQKGNTIQSSQVLLSRCDELLTDYFTNQNVFITDNTTQTIICNKALSLAGYNEKISSSYELSNIANLVQENYQYAIDYCLSHFNFDFLYKKVALTSSNVVTYSLNKFTYAYKLPADFSKPLFIDNGGEFSIVTLNNEPVICTSKTAPVNFNYITKTIDFKAIPNKILEAIEYYLASRLVTALGNEESIQNQKGNSLQTSQMLLSRCDELLTDYYTTQNIFITDNLTETEICNKALSLTGHNERILSLNELTKIASLLKENLNQSIEFCFTAFPFAFLLKKTTVTEKVTYSLSNYKYAYKLPTDFRLGLFISDSNNNAYTTINVSGTSYICTDAIAPFSFVYLQKTVPLAQAPIEMKEAIEYYLASRIVDSVKLNEEMADSNGNKFTTQDVLAKTANSILENLYASQTLTVTDEKQETNVVNTALSFIGNNTITSLNEQTKIGLICKNNYSKVLQGLLSQGNFSFNRKDEVITKDNLTSIVSLPYKYTYTIPSDVLKVLYIEDVRQSRGETINTKVDKFNFRIQGNKRYLVTDKQAPFVIQYQSTCDDISLLSPAFLLAFQYILASQLCVALGSDKSSASLQNNLQQQGLLYLNLAIGQDAQQGADSIKDNYCSFIEARHGY